MEQWLDKIRSTETQRERESLQVSKSLARQQSEHHRLEETQREAEFMLETQLRRYLSSFFFIYGEKTDEEHARRVIDMENERQEAVSVMTMQFGIFK